MNNLKTKIIFLSLFTILTTQAFAGVFYAKSYEKAARVAKDNKAILIILAHGSDWNAHSENVYQSLFVKKTIRRSLPKGNIVFLDIPILQEPTELQKKKNDERRKGFKVKGLKTYPAICAFAPDGTLLAIKQGESLPTDLNKINDTVLSLINDSRSHYDLKVSIIKAKAAKNTKAELAALIKIVQLPLNQSPDLLKRLKELDPKDSSGIHARAAFPHWHKLYSDTTGRTKKEEGAIVEKELNEMLKNKAYTKEQLATIHVALGICHRHQKGHETQAAAAFKRASQLAPKTLPGQTGASAYETWYTKKK